MTTCHWKNDRFSRIFVWMNQHESAAALFPAEQAASRPPINPAVRARWAASLLFLVDGMTFGTWAALIPSFQQKFALSTGQLSGVLAGLVVGAMTSMPLSGRLVSRRGSHRVVFASALAFPAALLALMAAPDYPWLVAAGVLFGLSKGFLDVSVNAQGIAVENALGKPIISSLNGFWSFGGLAAAAVLSAALSHGFRAATLLTAMALILMLGTLTTAGHLLPDRPIVAPRGTRNAWKLPNARLRRLAALAFLALFSEGVLLDWSGVYAHAVAGVSVATAPVAFAAFSICMAGGRFLGDFLLARWGTLRSLYFSAALMVLGMSMATMIQVWPAILAGFMIVGLGIANLVPIIFGAAGRAHENGAGPGVATVSTLGYTGFLCGPPVVGVLAAWAGLPVAFGTVIVCGLIVAAVGPAALRTEPSVEGV